MPVYPPNSRRKCRYLVEWERNDVSCTGFTNDISPTGIFIRTTHIPENGEYLTLDLLVKTGEKIRVKGNVVRSVRVPPNLRQYVPSGFCVRLVEAPEDYFRLLADLFSLRFGTTG